MLVNRYCQVIMESPAAFDEDAGIRRFSSNYFEIAERYLRTPANQNRTFSTKGGTTFPWKPLLWALGAAGFCAALYYV